MYDIIPDYFRIPDGIRRTERLESGKIHETFLVETVTGTGIKVRHVLQKINTHVFPCVPLLMRNTALVIRHVYGSEAPVMPVETRAGRLYFLQRKTHAYWRMYRYAENCRSYNAIPFPEIAAEAGKLLAAFHMKGKNLNPERLPCRKFFHDTPAYYSRLLKKYRQADSLHPAAGEIYNFITGKQGLAEILDNAFREKRIKIYLCHNDPKLSNMLFDADKHTGITMIDWDTAGRGYLAHDFGDAARSVCCSHDGSTHRFNFKLFELFTKAYLSVCGRKISRPEALLLFDGLKVISFELCIRYLTDYICGGIYFKNMNRRDIILHSLKQKELLTDIERHEAACRAFIIREYGKN